MTKPFRHFGRTDPYGIHTTAYGDAAGPFKSLPPVSEKAFKSEASEHARENTVGWAMTIKEGLHIDDDLLAHVDAALMCG